MRWRDTWLTRGDLVKAIVQERFGPPEVLQLVDTDPPGAGAGEVLVRVHTAALNPYDWHIMRGDPLIARLMGEVGLTKPKARVAGIDAAGVVEVVGANVRGPRHGDGVLGFCRGAFAQYARVRYDVILDNVGNRPLSRLRRALTPAGTLVLNGGGSPGHVFGPVAGILRAVVVNGLVRERLRLIPHEQKREQLLTLTGLIEAGKLTPVLDRTYPLAGTAEGLRRVEQGHARGKVVITVA
jgi:NADPH:quinone reductase-like Zn-dependent oxidoreductase